MKDKEKGEKLLSQLWNSNVNLTEWLFSESFGRHFEWAFFFFFFEGFIKF